MVVVVRAGRLDGPGSHLAIMAHVDVGAPTLLGLDVAASRFAPGVVVADVHDGATVEGRVGRG
jgi:hypothetical protein